MGFIKNFITECGKLDKIEESKGIITKTDIMNLNFSIFFKKFLLFMLKRANDFDYYYSFKNNNYDYLHEVPKELRENVETVFVRKVY